MDGSTWKEKLFGYAVLIAPFFVLMVLLSGCASTCPPGRNCVGEHASNIGGWGGIFGGFGGF